MTLDPNLTRRQYREQHATLHRFVELGTRFGLTAATYHALARHHGLHHALDAAITAEAQRLHDTLVPHHRGPLLRTARTTLHTEYPALRDSIFGAQKDREEGIHPMVENVGGRSASPRARARVGRLLGSVRRGATAVARPFVEMWGGMMRVLRDLGWAGITLWALVAIALGVWLSLIGSGLDRP